MVSFADAGWTVETAPHLLHRDLPRNPRRSTSVYWIRATRRRRRCGFLRASLYPTSAGVWHNGFSFLLPTSRKGNVFRRGICPPPPPAVLTFSGGHCNGRYASYWNAFLFPDNNPVLNVGWRLYMALKARWIYKSLAFLFVYTWTQVHSDCYTSFTVFSIKYYKEHRN